jgi:hypothetical protein
MSRHGAFRAARFAAIATRGHRHVADTKPLRRHFEKAKSANYYTNMKGSQIQSLCAGISIGLLGTPSIGGRSRRRHKASAQAFRGGSLEISLEGCSGVADTEPLRRHFVTKSFPRLLGRVGRRHAASAQAFRVEPGGRVADTKPLRRHFEPRRSMDTHTQLKGRRHKASAQAFRALRCRAASPIPGRRRHKASAQAFRARAPDGAAHAPH